MDRIIEDNLPVEELHRKIFMLGFETAYEHMFDSMKKYMNNGFDWRKSHGRKVPDIITDIFWESKQWREDHPDFPRD